MMRLALAAMMLPAAAAAPTCTADSCCVDMVQGMCAGNTHDAAGKAVGDTGYTAAEVTAVDCTGGDGTTAGNTANKGAGTTGRTNVLCCEAPAAAAPTWTCGDMIGDGTTTADPVTDTVCGAGWEADATATATALTAAFDVTIEAHKVACCTACVAPQFAGAADACADSSVTTCAAGTGWVGTTSADCTNAAGCCTACEANTWSGADDLNACAACDAGNVVEVGAGTGVATTAGTHCTTCAAGTNDHDGVSSTACQANVVATCAAGKGFVAGTATADGTCVDCVAGTNFDNTAAGAACVAITPATCAAGKGYASDATATTDDTAAACTDCPAGKFTSGTAQEACAACADGFVVKDAAPVVVTTAGTTCTTCTAGVDFDHDGIASTACQAVSTSPVTACPAGEGFHAATNKADAVCVACVVGSTFTVGVAAEACVAITAATCAAGKGYASDATATTDDTAAACTDCAAGKYGAGGVGVLAVCTDCAVGTFSAAGATTCTACASGLTTAAVAATVIADCVDNSAYCLLAMADDATDSDTDGQPFACPANKYVASDSQTAATTAVAQCTPVPATGAAITVVTTCATQAEVAAVTGVTGVTGGVAVVVLDGPDTVTTEVVGVTGVTAVAASCTKTAGAGTCRMVTPVTAVSAADTTCPEPVAAAKVSSAAAAAPLAAVAALLAAMA